MMMTVQCSEVKLEPFNFQRFDILLIILLEESLLEIILAISLIFILLFWQLLSTRTKL